MHDYQAFNTVKVLIADDDSSMRNLLRTAVTQWGYQVIEASNGEEAWEIMQQADPPWLLIIDWKMPKLDGIALCERIRKNLSFHPYVIFLTQMSGTTNILKGFEAGADEFLLKPVNFTELRTRVFAGERIISCLKMIDEQNKQIQSLHSYIKTLEAVILMKLGEKSDKKN